MTPDPPPHPLPALTASELSRYRRDLEHSLSAVIAAPDRTRLQGRLADVLAEQESRVRLRRAARR